MHKRARTTPWSREDIVRMVLQEGQTLKGPSGRGQAARCYKRTPFPVSPRRLRPWPASPERGDHVSALGMIPCVPPDAPGHPQGRQELLAELAEEEAELADGAGPRSVPP